MSKYDNSLRIKKLQEIVDNLDHTLENQKMTTATKVKLTKLRNQRKKELDELTR